MRYFLLNFSLEGSGGSRSVSNSLRQKSKDSCQELKAQFVVSISNNVLNYCSEIWDGVLTFIGIYTCQNTF